MNDTYIHCSNIQFLKCLTEIGLAKTKMEDRILVCRIEEHLGIADRGKLGGKDNYMVTFFSEPITTQWPMSERGAKRIIANMLKKTPYALSNTRTGERKFLPDLPKILLKELDGI